MNLGSLIAFLHMGLANATSLTSLDASAACVDEARVSAIIERHAKWLPRRADVTMRTAPASRPGSSVVEVVVRVEGETQTVERQLVNSCEEAYAFLDFYLSVWAPSVAEETPRDASKPIVPPSVLLGGFSHLHTNHPTGLGWGVGLGLDLSLDYARLGAFGLWYNPLVLEGTGEKADYDLHRYDLGGNLCAKAMTSPVGIWPCLGVSVRRYFIPAAQVGPGADRDFWMASADASLIVARSLTPSLALETALSVRHTLGELDLGTFKVGDFSPSGFEVGLRFGVTWDVPALFSERPSHENENANKGDGNQPW